MNNVITDTIMTHWRAKGKTRHTTSGWVSGNAVCCSDTRMRGGIIINDNTLSYSCFNCGFKASWQDGRALSEKIRKLMKFLYIPDADISKLSMVALRTLGHHTEEYQSIIPTFKTTKLPDDSKPILELIEDCPDKLIPVLQYLSTRNLFLEDYSFYWSPTAGYSNRLIIPFFYQRRIVGYTARIIANVKPKYMSSQQPGYVFNIDSQTYARKFAIVCEGPIDAISISGCAVMGGEIKESQAWLLRQLNKEIIVVPDKDPVGAAMVNQAIEYGFSVSMPDWPDGVKDINDAIIKLGRLSTLWLIVSAKESYALKIQLKAKKWFNQHKEYE
jgi:Toprim-like